MVAGALKWKRGAKEARVGEGGGQALRVGSQGWQPGSEGRRFLCPRLLRPGKDPGKGQAVGALVSAQAGARCSHDDSLWSAVLATRLAEPGTSMARLFPFVAIQVSALLPGRLERGFWHTGQAGHGTQGCPGGTFTSQQISFPCSGRCPTKCCRATDHDGMAPQQMPGVLLACPASALVLTPRARAAGH